MRPPRVGRFVLVSWQDIASSEQWEEPQIALDSGNDQFDHCVTGGFFLGVSGGYWKFSSTAALHGDELDRVASTYKIPPGVIRGWRYMRPTTGAGKWEH